MSHGKHLRVTFRLRTGDKIILEQIKNKLKNKGFSPILTLDIKKGNKSPSGSFKLDIYNLTLNKKKDIYYLIKKILPLSLHNEKTRKMNFILENKGKKWNEIEFELNELKKQIKKELLKNQIKNN